MNMQLSIFHIIQNWEKTIPTWNMKSLLFTFINQWTDFHTKKYWTLYFIYEYMIANFPTWNVEFSIYHIWNLATHLPQTMKFSMYHIWKSLPKLSSRKYWTLCTSRMKNWVLKTCAIRNHVYFGYQNLCTNLPPKICIFHIWKSG